MQNVILKIGLFFCAVFLWSQVNAQTLPYTFRNNSRYADNEIYVGLVGQFPDMGNVWMNMENSQLKVMSYADNTLVGPSWANTPDGKNKYAAIFTRLSDIPGKTIQIPHGLFGCRVLISFKSPMYIYFHQGGGYAGANLQNPNDPNDGIRWELVELTWGNAGLWTNTSRVDAYQYPMGLEVTGYSGNINGTYLASYNARVKDGSNPDMSKKIGELRSHQAILNEWINRTDPAFHGCKVVKTHSMDQEAIIEQPSKTEDFRENGPYRNYFAGYIDQIWSAYRTRDLLLNIGDRGTWRGRVTGDRFDFYDPADNSQATIYRKPGTQDAIEGSGALASSSASGTKYQEDLMIQAQVCAAINRHAIYPDAETVQNNHDASRYFKTEPFNHYVRFFHSKDISYQSQTYAFAYDDVGDQSSTIQCTFPVRVNVVIGGYGEAADRSIQVPGIIEAESFSSMQGVQTEVCADAGGGENVGWIDTGDWMEYAVDVSETGDYDFTFRSASLGSGGNLLIEVDGVKASSAVALPVTGGWQTWAGTVLRKISLTKGAHILRILAINGGFNLNNINVKENPDQVSAGFLRAEGKNIINNNGNFQIRATNIGNYMIQEGYMLNLGSGYQHIIKQKIADVVGTFQMEQFYDNYRAGYFTKADVDSIASWGFNSIRLPMHYNLFTEPGKPDVFYEKGFALVDQIISWCKEDNLYVILDLHAAPGGQSSGDICDYVSGQSSLWEDVSGSKYTSEQNRKQTVALWKKFAERYADEETVGGYDLINETNWTIPGNALLYNLMKEITAAIRTADKNHLIFIEGNSYANDYTGMTPVWDSNMAFSFHKYWNDVTDSSLDFILRIRDEQNVPVWLGEFGENSNHWVGETVGLMNKYNIGWAVWPYKKMGSISGTVAFREPQNWKMLADYIKGGTRPSAELGQSILNELTENVKLGNCTVNHGYINALFPDVESETRPFKPINLPSVIPASHYDEGKNGEAYNDLVFRTTHFGSGGGDYTAWNTGWYFRNDGVDLQYSEAEKSAVVAWTEENEWLNYTVNVPLGGSFMVSAGIAGMGGRISLSADGIPVISNIAIPSTGNWDVWQKLDLGTISLSAGKHLLRLGINQPGFNISYLEFTDQIMSTNDVTSEDKITVSSVFIDYTDIVVNTSDKLPVSVVATDVNGVEVFRSCEHLTNEPVTFGADLLPGMYIINLVYGNKSKVLKVVKI
jgi:hypothetical protein